MCVRSRAHLQRGRCPPAIQSNGDMQTPQQSNPSHTRCGGDSWDTALSTMRCSTASQYGSTSSCSAGSKEPHCGVHRSMTLVAVSVCLRCRALRWSLVLFVRYLPCGKCLKDVSKYQGGQNLSPIQISCSALPFLHIRLSGRVVSFIGLLRK